MKRCNPASRLYSLPLAVKTTHVTSLPSLPTIQACHTALYRSAFDLAQYMADVEATSTRKDLTDNLCTVDLLVLEDMGMKRILPTAEKDLLEIVIYRYEKVSIIMTTNCPLEDWSQVL